MKYLFAGISHPQIAESRNLGRPCGDRNHSLSHPQLLDRLIIMISIIMIMVMIIIIIIIIIVICVCTAIITIILVIRS